MHTAAGLERCSGSGSVRLCHAGRAADSAGGAGVGAPRGAYPVHALLDRPRCVASERDTSLLPPSVGVAPRARSTSIRILWCWAYTTDFAHSPCRSLVCLNAGKSIHGLLV